MIGIVGWELGGDDDGVGGMWVVYYMEEDGWLVGMKVEKEEVMEYEEGGGLDCVELGLECGF